MRTICIVIFCILITSFSSTAFSQTNSSTTTNLLTDNWFSNFAGTWTLKEARAVKPAKQGEVSAVADQNKGYQHNLSFPAKDLKNGFLTGQYRLVSLPTLRYVLTINTTTGTITTLLLPPLPGNASEKTPPTLVIKDLILIEGKVLEVSPNSVIVQTSVKGHAANVTFTKSVASKTLERKTANERSGTPQRRDLSAGPLSTLIMGKWHLVKYDMPLVPNAMVSTRETLERNLQAVIGTNSYKNNIHSFEENGKYTYQFYFDKWISGEKILIDGEYSATEATDAMDSTLRGLLFVTRLDYQTNMKSVKSEDLYIRLARDKDFFPMDGNIIKFDNRQFVIKRSVEGIPVTFYYTKIE